MSDARRAYALPDLEAEAVRDFLRAEPGFVRDDFDLLKDLGLRLDAANLVDFGPAALARVSAAHKRETTARRHLEATARANFAAQAQTHAAVIDILEARNHSDLAVRIDDLAMNRFGLAAGAIALEGPERVPAGWFPLVESQVDMILDGRGWRMGFHFPALALFGDKAEQVRSMAMVRMGLWGDTRQAILAFGSPEHDGFTPDMGPELVAFLAEVTMRTAERWPVL